MDLAIVGDVMLGRLVNETLTRTPPDYPWGDTLSVLNSSDLRLCNLECAISDRGKPWAAPPKEFHFRSDAKNAQVLRSAGIDVVSLANNHSLDFGYTALIDTVEILDKAGIKHAGAGSTIHEAQKPAILNVRDNKVGVLAFTDNEPEWEATMQRAGIFYVPVDLEDNRAAHLLELVSRWREKVDLLIVSAHWGPNWGYEPPREHISFGHALIDAGADVVFGHSGHVFRGIEIYRRRPILYCLGDFIDDYAVDPIERNDQSCIFVVEAERDGARALRLFPTMIDLFQARIANESEAQEIGMRMRSLCARFNTRIAWKGEDHRYLEVELS